MYNNIFRFLGTNFSNNKNKNINFSHAKLFVHAHLIHLPFYFNKNAKYLFVRSTQDRIIRAVYNEQSDFDTYLPGRNLIRCSTAIFLEIAMVCNLFCQQHLIRDLLPDNNSINTASECLLLPVYWRKYSQSRGCNVHVFFTSLKRPLVELCWSRRSCGFVKQKKAVNLK